MLRVNGPGRVVPTRQTRQSFLRDWAFRSLTPPSARRDAVSWTDSAGNFWVFGGESPYAAGTGYPNDLWRYNSVSSEWTLIRSALASELPVYGVRGVASPANLPGGRHWASSWIDQSGDLWLFGGIGFDTAGMWGLLNDLWRYHPATNEWTWISGSQNAYGLSVYGPLGAATASAVPGARDRGITFTDDSGDLWLFGGFGDQPDGQSRGPRRDVEILHRVRRMDSDQRWPAQHAQRIRDLGSGLRQ